MQELRECIRMAGDANNPPEFRRAQAVAAALILIASKASGADSTNLGVEVARTGIYADQIQAALQVK